MNLSDIAATLGCELRGEGSTEITGVAGMEHAGPTEITFLANPKYAPKVKHTRAAAILVKTYFEDIAPAQLLSRNPYLDFARALELFYQPPGPAPGIHPLACVAPERRDRRKRVDRTVRGGGRKCRHWTGRGAPSACGDL